MCKRFVLAATGVILLTSATPSLAGFVEVNNNTGSCSSSFDYLLGLGWVKSLAQISVTPTQINLGGSQGTVDGAIAQKNYAYQPVSVGGAPFTCQEGRTDYFQNDPNGPNAGAIEAGWSPTGGWLKFSVTAGCTAIGIAIGAVGCGPTLGAGCIAAAGATSFCAGFLYGISENSPAALLLSNFGELDLPASLSIPFVVTNAGDGDWLAMGVNGTEFLRQPLSTFLENEVYGAVVPTEFLILNDVNFWTFSLESAGSPQARVLLSFTPVPIPAAVWLFGSALGLLGWMKRRAA